MIGRVQEGVSFKSASELYDFNERLRDVTFGEFLRVDLFVPANDPLGSEEPVNCGEGYLSRVAYQTRGLDPGVRR